MINLHDEYVLQYHAIWALLEIKDHMVELTHHQSTAARRWPPRAPLAVRHRAWRRWGGRRRVAGKRRSTTNDPMMKMTRRRPRDGDDGDDPATLERGGGALGWRKEERKRRRWEEERRQQREKTRRAGEETEMRKRRERGVGGLAGLEGRGSGGIFHLGLPWAGDTLLWAKVSSSSGLRFWRTY